jgi:hypothetical protein
MNERRFQPPALPSFTPGEKQYGDRIRWRSETAMILSATELGAFGLLYATPSFPQVTMGCDPKLSAFADMKGLTFVD